MDFNFEISDEAREYLVLQKGALWAFKDDPVEWDKQYNRSLNNTYKTIFPFLPEQCESVLDVGSGLGGINAILGTKYPDLDVWLLDGVFDAPVVAEHRKTFNDMKRAREFLKLNGIDKMSYISPNEVSHDISLSDMDGKYREIKFDIVLSFGAWCFHFPPSEYLQFVKDHCKSGTVIILDVRKAKPEWLADLHYAFGDSEIIRSTRKFDKRKFVYAG